jgi:release factor glutamine methyltransferase
LPGREMTASIGDCVVTGAQLPAMSIGTLIAGVVDRLHGVEAHERTKEARDIVATLLDVTRNWVAGHQEAAATPELIAAAFAAAARRARGAPLAYAVGRAAFRHLVLSVDERVLIPRPETEGLVDLVLGAKNVGGVAVDVGTGSGAITLALASEGRFDRVIGTDISTDAIAVAESNAHRLASGWSATVEFRAGS